MTAIARRRPLMMLAALLVPIGLAGCGATDDPPMNYSAPSYDYLTKIRLNVASVDIDDSAAPNPDPRDVTRFAPIKPVDALRQMAQDRLIAQGATGRAVFVIDRASIIQNRDRYEGRMTAHLDISTSDGTRSGYAEATVQRTSAITKDGPNATRAALNNLVTQMMSDMNVEFEFQVRRSLRSYLATTSPTDPAPTAIQTASLTAPKP
jgi:hypothetical protein